MLCIAAMKRRVAALVLASALAAIGAVHGAEYREEIPFVPTPIEVIDSMLELAEVKKGDMLYDLGSGDGRIVIRAAKKYGIHAVGIEMDRSLLDQARRDAKSAGVTRLVEFRSEDALKANISKATVITLYIAALVQRSDEAELRKTAQTRQPHRRPRLRHRGLGTGSNGQAPRIRIKARWV